MSVVRKSFYAASLFLTMGLSAQMFAYDFSAADSLYALRGNGSASQQLAAYHEARAAYEKALGTSLSASEKEYAVTQMSRLDIFAGGMIPDLEDKERRVISESCYYNLDKLDHNKTEAYYYFKITCVALRGKYASWAGDRASWGVTLKGLQSDALKLADGGFEGGGIYRTMSGVRGNRKAKPLGLYAPAEAVSFAQKALAAPAQESRPFPDTLSGKDYYENYYYLGQANVALGIEEDSLNGVKAGNQILANAIEELQALVDEEALPQGREPEAKHYLKELKSLKETVDSCVGERKWAKCLTDKLD